MNKFILSCFTLLLTAFTLLSCGTNSSSMMGPSGGLQSITLNPSTADARAYPDSQVPFVATGNYVDPLRKLTPQPAMWGACQQNSPTMEVTVSQTGVAQCMAGATGKYTVFAYDMTNCTAITVCGGGCTILGTAQLTCP